MYELLSQMDGKLSTNQSCIRIPVAGVGFAKLSPATFKLMEFPLFAVE